MKNSLNNGQKWDIGSSFNFNTQVEVKLWDEDWPDPDDFLGSVIIDTSLIDHATASFTQEGANYQLLYSVADVPIPVDPVTQAITRFETSLEPGVWPNIRKVDLLTDIRKRTKEPYLINQDHTPLCGPAAIVFELVSRQSSRYIEICQEALRDRSIQVPDEGGQTLGYLAEQHTSPRTQCCRLDGDGYPARYGECSVSRRSFLRTICHGHHHPLGDERMDI